jgi:hypothetical protein
MNAGKFVGNYNYRKIYEIIRRIDFKLLDALGFSKNEAVNFLGIIKRV